MARFDQYDLEGDDEVNGGRPAPERLNRRPKPQQQPKRARSSRSNDAAKRGMHQRRNKRAAW